MRKLFLSIAAVATLLASCSKEDGLTGVSKSQVTFTVSSPELATRAGDYGNGEKATTLYYAVYDAVENATEKGLVRGLSRLEGEDFTGGKKEVTINLVEGRTYDIIFYAQNADGSPYEPDWVERTLEIKTPTDLKANQETYDAFYAHVDNLKVGTAAINETVYLRRPFAQLNVLTNDLDKGAAAGIDIAQTSVTVKNIYTKMNLFTDKVDPASETAVTYALSDVLKDDNGKIVSAVVDNTTYHWLTMNYLLVNDKKMVDVEFTMTDSTVADSSKDNKLVRNYSTVPVERNHRTNIYGSIITNPAKFNVEIKPEFLKPDHNVNGGEQYTVTVATADELQKAIDNAKVGRTIITFEQDIDANSTRSSSPATITISQKENVDLVIDGDGYKFDGTFYVDGNGKQDNAETLAFLNINFNTSSSGTIYFIDADKSYNPNNGTNYNYAHNVTVDGCTFTGSANSTVVGLRIRQGKNISVVNTTVNENMHSLMQLYGSDGVYIDRVNATKDLYEGGMAFGTSKNVFVKNSQIATSTGFYGLRADGSENNSLLTIENTSIQAKAPIAVRSISNANNYAVVLDSKTTLTSTGLYDVIFTAANINNEASLNSLTAPTGKWSITGAEGLNVYPTVLTEGFKANSSEQLSQAIAGGVTTVNLEEGTYIIPDAAQGKTLTIIGTGDPEDTVIAAQDDGAAEGDCDYSFDGATVTFENVTITTSTTYFPGYARMKGTYKKCIINGVYTLYDNSTFEDCTFTVSGDVYNIWTWGAPTATFTRCTFNCDGKAMLLYGTANTKLTMNDCIFNDKGGLTDLKAAIEIGNDYNKSYELIVNNATVNGFEINDKGINTGTTLWANKNSMGKDKLNVVVDGVDVY